MKIWYIRHETGHPRSWGRQNALAGAFSDHDFEIIHSVGGLEHLRGQKADLAIIAGKYAAAVVRTQLKPGKMAPFRVYIPSWKRGMRDCKLQMKELGWVKYHLVIPDQTMFLDQYKQVNPNVHYVDRGFDPTFFYPGAEGEKTREIVFCGNYQAYDRQPRLKMLLDVHPGRVEWRRLPYRKLPDYLRSATIGWNQIMRGPPTYQTCINYRVWETVACGILLLCSYSVDIPLTPSIHYAGWDSEVDMMRKAKHFLGNNAHRLEIAEAGYREALAKHTWTHRGQQYREIITSCL